MPDHPCLSCGACCAHYRVAFHWSETEPAPASYVPIELTTALDPHRLAMRGTLSAPVRCTALSGAVGRDAQCTVYARRPSPCRELQPAWEHGEPSPQCDRARVAYGLAPLTPEAWTA
ncbi:YkgJ family cysteine cluster protein [Cognatilysobacter bugurensis]|uniref:Zinc/iron-chelating domain-containing protein n=1 Tax=Cognatilysobacter bugurensis TaxID=543356 RepID=A0A918T426_9GAMM|nr:YkgJ family cysteine cluster protein [Lysobacter bugurensis]GHA87571.1 zinc/iron-chelating domain-containing protein [Lysobacter bugurensis]